MKITNVHLVAITLFNCSCLTFLVGSTTYNYLYFCESDDFKHIIQTTILSKFEVFANYH